MTVIAELTFSRVCKNLFYFSHYLYYIFVIPVAQGLKKILLELRTINLDVLNCFKDFS